MSKIVQRSIQIEDEIPVLKSLDRRFTPAEANAIYQYSERSLKLLKAAAQQISNPNLNGYPVQTRSEEVISIPSDSDSDSESIELVEEIN